MTDIDKDQTPNGTPKGKPRLKVVQVNPTLQAARWWAEQGHPVIPLWGVNEDGTCQCIGNNGGKNECAPGDPNTGKHPWRGMGIKAGATTNDGVILGWFRSRPDLNLALRCDGLVVVDVDPRNNGHVTAESLDLPSTRAHTTGSYSGELGRHHIYRLPEGFDSQSSGTLGDGIDLKTGPGAYVVLPPSMHASGVRYAVAADEPIADAPAYVLAALGPAKKRATVKGAELPVTPTAKPITVSGRSMLSHLLANPPTEGGRNVWLARVAGHLAKAIEHVDAYHELVRLANDSLSSPLDEDEWRKVAGSLWITEQATALEPAETNGWLKGSGSHLITECKRGSGDDTQTYFEHWSNFDMTCTGIVMEDQSATYTIELRVAGKVPVLCSLAGALLGRAEALRSWLAEREAVIHPPHGETHPGREGGRLQLYLQAQNPPTVQAIDCLGWNDALGGFVTHEGLLTAAGFQALCGVTPAPVLTDWAPYRYGTTEVATARAVLGELLTFHDPTVCALFGAWWAACWLKGQITAKTALFPFMALEAPSESGKTNGFFALMLEANGNTEGHTEMTMAVLRDRLSAHRNGIVWMDDLSSFDQAFELLRQSTSEGSRSKKGQDRRSNESVKLVAPVVVSGEGMGALWQEKALIDRSVVVSVPSPVGRKSRTNENRSQWLDIVDLKARHGSLVGMAGTFAQLALGQVGLVDQLDALRPYSGRQGDKLAVLRLGARVLAGMADESDWVIEAVDRWAGLEDRSTENVLTTKYIPDALVAYGSIPRKADLLSPAWVDSFGRVWWSAAHLARTVGSVARDGRTQQLAGEHSLIDQYKQLVQSHGLGVPTMKRWGVGPRDQRVSKRYLPLPMNVSRAVIERTGLDLEGVGQHALVEEWAQLVGDRES